MATDPFDLANSSDDNDDNSWQDEVQCYRMLLVERIRYPFISAALQSVKVIDREDDEELNNNFIYRTTKMRTNGFIDILLRKGEANYKKFLQVLGIFYPDVYTEITGNKPPDASNIIPSPNPEQHTDNIELIHLLMQALDGMKHKVFDTSNQLRKINSVAEERLHENERLKQSNNELNLRIGRYETIENEMAALRSENDKLKTDNYTVCLRMMESNEENRQLRVTVMNTKNENDRLTVELQRVKRSMDLESSKSVRLRLKLDAGPNENDVIQMQREISELKLKLAKANNDQEVNDEDMRLQILRNDKKEALEMYEEAVKNLHSQREKCAVAETLRDQYLDEKDQLALTCTALQSDCEMYKKRRDLMWQQLQEVEKEREMLMKERNEAQLNTKTCMEEKARYRTEIRELEKKYDEVNQKCLELERELIRQKRPRVTSMENEPYTGSLSPIPTATSSMPSPSSRDPSETASELGQFRPRAYNTKHYSKYVSKNTAVVLNETSESPGTLGLLFPEIPLALDYPSPKKVRRRIAQNRRTLESSVCESVSSNSCTDED